MITLNCDFCGTSFKTYPSEINKGRRYCSSKCANSARVTFKTTKKVLETLYIEKRLSVRQIANVVGFSYSTVLAWMHKYGIKRRNKRQACKNSYEQGRNPTWKGKTFSKEHRENIASSLEGVTPWSKGLKRPKHSDFMKEKWQDEEYRDKTLKAQRAGANTRPTSPEQSLIDLIEKHSLPFKYTGDGSFWIENLNPDFVECNGRKLAVEVFGDYWHSPLLNSNVRYCQTFEGREELMHKYGWDLVVLWESELMSDSGENIVLSRLGGL